MRYPNWLDTHVIWQNRETIYVCTNWSLLIHYIRINKLSMELSGAWKTNSLEQRITKCQLQWHIIFIYNRSSIRLHFTTWFRLSSVLTHHSTLCLAHILYIHLLRDAQNPYCFEWAHAVLSEYCILSFHFKLSCKPYKKLVFYCLKRLSIIIAR